MTALASEDVSGGVALEFLRRLGDAAAGGDVGRALEYCTDDVCFEFPFAEPASAVTGRERVRGMLQDAFARYRFTLSEPETYLAGDVMFCEFTSRGTVLATGGLYANRYVALVRVRDGRVDLYREYFHPISAEEGSATAS